MSIQVFLSAVTDEFLDYRAQLRHDLERQNVTVKIQEDFKDLGSATLDKLDVYIAACDGVVHLVGDMTGAAARTRSTKGIIEKYADFISKLPPLRQPFEDRLDISYTQWEAWLALYHDKLLLIAEADEHAPRGPRFTPTDASRASQRAHLERLRVVERYPPCRFTSPDNLAKQILSSAILDLLVAESVRVISSATKQLNAAVANKKERYDQKRLAKLKGLLSTTEALMVTVNASKRSNLEAFRDYLDKKPFADKWTTIQKSCTDISDSLRKLRSDIEGNELQFVRGIGFENAGDLQAALQNQEKIYQRLSTFPEPVTNADRKKLGATVDRLEALRKQVVALESSIETYLTKFA